MKITLLAIVCMLSLQLNNSKAMAESCIDKKDPNKAFLREVKIAVSDKGTIATIKKTFSDFHSPEYDVTLVSGKVVHVTCDDSGDDQCGCEIGSHR